MHIGTPISLSEGNGNSLWHTWSRLTTLLVVLSCLTLVASGCATPISAKRTDPRSVHRELTSNVLSTGEPSNFTRIVLNQADLAERFAEEPEKALAILHAEAAKERDNADEIFALAELSFLHAENTGQRPYYLAAAVYAFAFLFPQGTGDPPNPFDPRLRVAADLYNRGITDGLISADGSRVELRASVHSLPFGELQIAFDSEDLQWADRKLVDFVPIAEYEIRGLRNRYRHPGLGAPLAAGTVPLNPEQGFQDFVAPGARVPVTALLSLDDARRQLTENRLRASLELYPSAGAQSVLIGGRRVPLEVEPTAALAFQLSESVVWEMEYQGFLIGDVLSSVRNLLPDKLPQQLVALEPYHPGRIPVVFVHGTVSSPARWADMVNDLYNDPRIRERFQFWVFFYNTGNPIPYSALQLRDALRDTVARLDPEGRDPALRQMVVIGHSQGGLLTRMTAMDLGTRLWDTISTKPLDEVDLPPETRELIQRMLFIKPLPFVRRVVFIATPHRGSYVAGNWISHQVARLVSLPARLLTVTTALERNPEIMSALGGQIGSVYGMTPGSPAVQAFSSTPIAPGVASHSIVAVKGDGPVEEGNDGVVAYSSAHLEDADSELVVRSSHSVQSNPHAIEEVRRILLLHSDECCKG